MQFLNRHRRNWKNTILFNARILEQIRFEGIFHEIKSAADITLNGEKLEAFSLKSGTRQGGPMSPL